MRSPFRLGLVAAALLTGVLAVPSHAAITRVDKTYIVPTRHGDLFIEVAHAAVNGKLVRAGSVLTYSPYNAGFGRNGDAGSWIPHGLTRITADVVGTANSGGCYDYGGKREKESAYDLVEWIAKQPWSNGKVGMIGGSYDGTTAMAAAVARPPHLTTIVPEAAISRWYDYAYSGGMRYTFNNERMGHENPGLIIDEQGFDTPLGFDLGFGNTPPTDVGGEKWAERTASAMTPCDEVDHIESGYNVNPDYDAFWLERDYAKDAHKITIPVLVAYNWGDWNVKQETSYRFWQAAKNSRFRRIAVGTRWEGHGTPGGEYKQLRVDWMRHWLQGAKTNVLKTPPVISQMADSKGTLDFYRGAVPKTSDVKLYAQVAPVNGFDQALLPTKPREPEGEVSYVLTGDGSESKALAGGRTPGSNAAWFETPTLKRDVRIFGAPKVQVWSTVQRSWVTYAVSVVDIDPAFYRDAGGNRTASETNALLGVTRGWLDTRYRRTLAKREPWTKVGLNGATVVAKPQDYVFRKGHAIGLLIMGEHTEWVVPKAYDDPAAGASPLVTVDTTGRTVLHLPVVGSVSAKSLF